MDTMNCLIDLFKVLAAWFALFFVLVAIHPMPAVTPPVLPVRPSLLNTSDPSILEGLMHAHDHFKYAEATYAAIEAWMAAYHHFLWVTAIKTTVTTVFCFFVIPSIMKERKGGGECEGEITFPSPEGAQRYSASVFQL